jgi:hypothetical protein
LFSAIAEKPAGEGNLQLNYVRLLRHARFDQASMIYPVKVKKTVYFGEKASLNTYICTSAFCTPSI